MIGYLFSQLFLLFLLAATKTVISVKQTSRNVLMKLHTEYTSITDELENVMITSPDGQEKQRHVSCDNSHILSNAEIAAHVERQHLKECEESDYKILSKLFHDRCAVAGMTETDEAVRFFEYLCAFWLN